MGVWFYNTVLQKSYQNCLDFEFRERRATKYMPVMITKPTKCCYTNQRRTSKSTTAETQPDLKDF